MTNGLMKSVMTAAVAASALGAVAPAMAQDYQRDDGYYDRDGNYHRNDDRYDRNYYDRTRYDDRDGPRTWRGDDGRYYCRRSDGTTGTVVGGVGGAVAGAAIGGNALGAVIGGVSGALLGRTIDKHHSDCR